MWILGESRYVYTLVSGVSPTTISGAHYTIYNIEDESMVASGVASVSDQVIFCLWQPEESGVYVADLSYYYGVQHLTSRQVVEIRETM